jgi:hypothetical protein
MLLSVTNKPIMLSVFMLSVMAPYKTDIVSKKKVMYGHSRQVMVAQWQNPHLTVPRSRVRVQPLPLEPGDRQ